MGTTKSSIFSKSQNELADLAKALGHPARIAILDYLQRANSCICGDLVLETGLAQATVSQHLKELKKVGLIQGTISGPSTCYCINAERWNEVRELLGAFLKPVNGQQCC